MEQLKNQNLVIPIYLNEKIVFDMLATIEHGFSMFTQIETTNTKGSNHNGEIAMSGVGNIMGLFKLKGSLTGKGEVSRNNESTVSEEKIHTTASLFGRLYEYLNSKNLITQIVNETDFDNIQIGDFVEVNGTLKLNNLISVMDSMISMLELALSLDSKSSKVANNKIIEQMKMFSNGLKAGNMIDLVCNIQAINDIKAVLPVYINNFVNNNMNEVVDGEYRVLGKIVKILPNNSEESINLLRNTSFSLFNQLTLLKILNNFNSSTTEGLNMPEVNVIIKPPVLQIIPIAIYV